MASHHCSRTVDGVARDAVKFIGRPAHTIDECAAGKIPSDISEATVNVLTNATVGGMDAIGWWWIADWVKNICPIVADGAEIAGEVQSTKGGVTTYFTCIFGRKAFTSFSHRNFRFEPYVCPFNSTTS